MKRPFSYLGLILWFTIRLSAEGISQISVTEVDTLFTAVKIRKGDTLYDLFGPKYWKFVSRLNKVGPLALREGMVLRFPRDWKMVGIYKPAPESIEETKDLDRFVLVDLGEQYVAGYENGLQKFWFPASSGWDTTRTPKWYIKYVVRFDRAYSNHAYKKSLPDMRTPTGFFWVKMKDSVHVSSVFMTEDSVGSPMPWAVMFEAGYWFHGTGNEPGSLPGFPASHGCIRLFDEDAFKFYHWVKYPTLVLIIPNQQLLGECLKDIPEIPKPKKNKK